ncbi:MAG: helix-turn-helix domain-containing protein [Steroidobacterales bacterium]
MNRGGVIVSQMTKAEKPARTLEELERLAVGSEAFREGYEQREGMIRLGAMLKQMRESGGYTQEALAARTGMTQPAISRLESGFGTHVPTIDTVMRYMHGCKYQLIIGAGHGAGADSAATPLDFQAVF